MRGKIAAIFHSPFVGDKMNFHAARGKRVAKCRRRKQMAAGSARRDHNKTPAAHGKAPALASARIADPGRFRITAIKKPIASAKDMSEEPP